MAFEQANRPDIAVALSLKALRGAAKYICHRIFPTVVVSEKGSTVSLAKSIIGSATVNRAFGARLTGTRVEPIDITYSTAAIEDRAEFSESDIKDAGGEEAAIASGANSAGLGVILNQEATAADKVISSIRYSAAETLDPNRPWDKIIEAAIAVKYYGDPVLVASESWFNNFVLNRLVGLHLRGIYGEQIMAEIVSNPERVLKTIGVQFGVKEILIGEDAAWQVSGREDAAAVVAIRRDLVGNPLINAKRFPVYGLGFTFLPDPAQPDAPFEIETAYDPGPKLSLVDATSHYAPTEVNPEGAVAIRIPADFDPVLDINLASGGPVDGDD